MVDNVKKFKESDWKKLSKILSIFPLGLNTTEILLLNILKEIN